MLVSSTIAMTGDQVMLLSPLWDFSQNMSLTFYFYMRLNPDDMTAALQVYQYSELHIYDRRLFIARGNQGNFWQSVSICLPPGKYRLAFLATVGRAYESDIAIEDISLSLNQNPCYLEQGFSEVGMFLVFLFFIKLLNA